MPNLLAAGKILELKTQILEGNFSDVSKYLTEQGYAYAGWARGLAEINYMADIALIGIGLFDCNNVSTARLLSIKADIAWMYLNSLEKFHGIDKDNNKRADITSEDILYLYETVLNNHNLSIDHWSLFAPFNIIKKIEGIEILEEYWNFVRDENAFGSNEALAANLMTLAYMNKQSSSSDFSVSVSAKNWLDHLPGICSAGKIVGAFNIMWNSISAKKKLDFERIMHALGLRTYLARPLAALATPCLTPVLTAVLPPCPDLPR